MENAPKYTKRLSNYIILSFLFPVLFLVLSSGLFFYFISKRSMDMELASRLLTIANLVSIQARDWGFTTLAVGDEKSLTYINTVTKLKKLKESSGVKKIYIFDKDNKSFADSQDNVPIGTTYYNHTLHLKELNLVKNGGIASSVLFKGSDGYYYKSGFAPVLDRDNRVIGLIGVEASADFFRSLAKLKNNIMVFMLIGILLTVVVGILISRAIVMPIRKLVDAARDIGAGNLKTDIEIRSSNELGFLASTINEMKDKILERDGNLRMMLAGIAHEVRNPLGGLELFAGLLKDELKNDRTRLKYVEKIQKEIGNLKNLVDEFLDFAKTTETSRVSTDVKELAQELRLNFTNEFKAKDIAFRIEMPGTLDRFDLDRDQMKRALLNIIKNSIEASPKGGISLRFGLAQGNLSITVEDTGEGMPESVIERAFEPFYTTKGRGSGLGLSFAKKIVNSHGGDINIVSKKGEGTSVTITIPKN